MIIKIKSYIMSNFFLKRFVLALLFFTMSCNETFQDANDELSDTPALDTPADESIDQSLTPILNWDPVSDQEKGIVYDVYLYPSEVDETTLLLTQIDESSDSNLLVFPDNEETTLEVSTSLEPNTDYEWYVVAKDENGEEVSTSEPSTFTTTSEEPSTSINTTPLTPVLVSPVNESIDQDLNPILSWEASLDLDGDKVVYNVYLDVNEDAETLLSENQEEINFQVVNSLEYETTYYWKVVSIDENGGISISTINSFTTIAQEEDDSDIDEDNSDAQEDDSDIDEDNSDTQEDDSDIDEDNSDAQEDDSDIDEDSSDAQEDDSDIECDQRQALINIYNKTGGDEWTRKTNWKSSKPLEEWQGVLVKEDEVIALLLPFNNLSGTIPSDDIVCLAGLKKINLSSNNLSGSISETFADLDELKFLSLSRNNLSGTIPEVLCENYKNRTYIVFSYLFNEELTPCKIKRKFK